MSDSDKDFVGSIPEIYDDYLVPLIFESYANDIASRVAAINPGRILETAAGSGVVARELIKVLGDDAQYTVTDLNQPMLDHAAAQQAEDSRLSWRQADALDLPFDDKTFDSVVCQFGVMFYPDRIKGFKEARRVLKSGGVLIFNVWDRIEENEFADVVTTAAATVFPDDPPMFMARTPHGYYDEALIRAELAEAGFGAVEYEALDAISSAPSPRHPAIAYCQGTPLRNEIEQRDASRLHEVTDVASVAIAERFGDGPVTARIRGFVISAGLE